MVSLKYFELADYYKDNYYDNVVEPAPPNKYVDLNESYFNKGYEYFFYILTTMIAKKL